MSFAPSNATIARTAPIVSSVTLVARAAAPVPAKPTFLQLLAAAPIPWPVLARLALQLEVDPLLLERISRGRQPLPRRLAARIAKAAGLAVGSVEAVVEITAVETPIAYRPVPADRCWGDELSFAPLARTASVVL